MCGAYSDVWHFISEGGQPRFKLVSVRSKMMLYEVLHLSLSSSEPGLRVNGSKPSFPLFITTNDLK